MSLYLISDLFAWRSDVEAFHLLRLVLKPHRKYSSSSLIKFRLLYLKVVSFDGVKVRTHGSFFLSALVNSPSFDVKPHCGQAWGAGV